MLLKNKKSIPVFYRGNKIWVRVPVRLNEITSEIAIYKPLDTHR